MELQFLGILFLLAVATVSGNNLCSQPGCSCMPNTQNEDLKDVSCECQEKQVSLTLTFLTLLRISLTLKTHNLLNHNKQPFKSHLCNKCLF